MLLSRYSISIKVCIEYINDMEKKKLSITLIGENIYQVHCIVKLLKTEEIFV